MEPDEWDPMKDDYEDTNFNSYDRGPGQYLPRDPSERKKSDKLFVTNLPLDLDESGVRNLFADHGTVLEVRFLRNSQHFPTNAAIVQMGSMAECAEALSKLNGFKIGTAGILRVQFNKTPNEVAKLRAQKQEQGPERLAVRNAPPKVKERSVLSRPDSDSLVVKVHNLPSAGRGLTLVQAAKSPDRPMPMNNHSVGQQQNRHINQPIGGHQMGARFQGMGNNGPPQESAACDNSGYASDASFIRRTNRNSSSVQQNASPAPGSPLSQNGPHHKGNSCACCHQLGRFKCSHCMTLYCSSSCQQQDWNKHKNICQPLSNPTNGVNISGEIIGSLNSSQIPQSPVTAQNGSPAIRTPVSSLSRQSLSPSRSIVSALSQSKQAPVATLPDGEAVQVKLVEFRTPSSFYVQRVDLADSFSKMHKDMQKAIECCLYGVLPSDGNVWREKDTEICAKMGLHTNGLYTVRCMSSDGVHQVLLYLPDGTTEIGHELLLLGYAKPDSRKKYKVVRSVHQTLQPGAITPVVIDNSSVKGVHQFYAQLAPAACHDEVKQVLESPNDLNAYCNSLKLPQECSFEAGDHVLARFLETGDWYRARVCQLSERSADVLFIDFGNMASVSLAELVPLPRRFSHLPQIASVCSLHGLVAVDVAAAAQHLQRLSDSNMVAEVNSVTSEGISITLKRLDDSNVNEELIRLGLAVATPVDLLPSPTASSLRNVSPQSLPKSAPAVINCGQVSTLHTAHGSVCNAPLPVHFDKYQQNSQKSAKIVELHDQPRQRSEVLAERPGRQSLRVKSLLNVGVDYEVTLRTVDDAFALFTTTFPRGIVHRHKELSASLDRLCKGSAVIPLAAPKQDEHVLFKYPQNDGANEWRRGCVSQISAQRCEALVLHLDAEYRDSSKVSYNNLFALSPEMVLEPWQSHPVCRLVGVTDALTLNSVLKPFLGHVLIMKVVSFKDYVYEVNLFWEGAQVTWESSARMSVQLSSSSKMPERKHWMAGQDWRSLELGSRLTEVFAVDIASAVAFYVQPTEGIELFREAVHAQAGLVQSCSPPTNFIKEEIVFAFNEECSDWDRVIILDPASAQSIAVRSIDYGNEYFVKAAKVRPLTRSAAELPVRGLKIALEGVSPPIPLAAKKMLAELRNVKLEVQMASKDSDIYRCHVWHEGRSLNQAVNSYRKQWIAGQDCHWMEFAVGTFEALVAEAESPLGFYVQPAVDFQLFLDTMVAEGAIAEPCSPPTDLVRGEVVFTYAYDYEEWDRVIILDHANVQAISVRSADYGKEYCVSAVDLRPLTDIAAKMPLRGIKWALEGVFLPLSSAALRSFSELTMQKIVMEVTSRHQVDQYYCTVFSNGQNVNQALNDLHKSTVQHSSADKIGDAPAAISVEDPHMQSVHLSHLLLPSTPALSEGAPALFAGAPALYAGAAPKRPENESGANADIAKSNYYEDRVTNLEGILHGLVQELAQLKLENLALRNEHLSLRSDPNI